MQKPTFRPFYVLALLFGTIAVASAVQLVLNARVFAQSLPSAPTLTAIRDPNYGTVCYYLNAAPYPGQISCVKVTVLSTVLN